MYTIGDFLIQIKNAYQARKKQVEYQFSNAVLSIGKVLEKEGYVEKVKEEQVDGRKKIIITLKYQDKIPAISDIKLVSKPSVHHYFGSAKIRKAVPSHGIGILSTNKGIMSNKQAQKENVGGELICRIY